MTLRESDIEADPVRVSVVVPTMGKSPWLLDCLRALQGEKVEILLVIQGDTAFGEARSIADRVLDFESPLGFAAANNRAFAVARGKFLATVNDDAIVEGGWLDALLDALENDPQAAAAQGCNVQMDAPTRIDGRGISWNRWWQAVQIDENRDLTSLSLPATEEIFGVSATAALYRRSALEAAGGLKNAFDERLESYYEDVDLAVRLRSLDLRSLSVSAARARHAGSLTGGETSRPLIYGNRYVVLRRFLGIGFWPRLPWIFLRDLLDLTRAGLRGEAQTLRGILAGWRRAVRLLKESER